MNVIIIGGVAAGTKIAAKLKRENRDCQVTILTKSAEISYAGCGLPYYVGHVIEERGELIVNTPQSFAALTGAEVITGTEVVSLDRQAKTVTAVELESGERKTYSYDKLVIASGARPFVPPVAGTDLKNVFTMRTPEDAFALRAAVDSGEIKRAVVVGGGFIGLEVAENLLAQGIRVSVVDMADHVLPGFDAEVQDYVENHLSEKGIVCFTGTRFEGLEGTDKVEKVLTSRKAMKADAVVLAIGIKANTEFLEGTGLEMMPNHTLKVDKTMKTNDPDIYAAGDCACVASFITGEPQWSPMGSSANIEGRIAAQHIAGKEISYRGVVGTGVCRLPGLDAGHTGLTEAQAKAAGCDAESVIVVVDDKAHYYPGAGNMIIKMVADKKTGKLLGVQALGQNAVDKVIDVAVTGLYLDATLDQLADMDLAYAPPFSTAIHPFVNAIYILKNKLEGSFETITPVQYAAGEAKDRQLIDASMKPSIEGAAYIDLTKVDGPLEEYPLDAKLLLVCAKGKRAYLLQNRLKAFGYTNTRVLEGGTAFSGDIEIE